MPNPIIGHQQIIEQLQHTVASDRIAGAYLFVGPTGVGKETVARYFRATYFLSARRAASDGMRHLSRLSEGGLWKPSRFTIHST